MVINSNVSGNNVENCFCCGFIWFNEMVSSVINNVVRLWFCCYCSLVWLVGKMECVSFVIDFVLCLMLGFWFSGFRCNCRLW